jgi:PAT family beta-lactamase induction signal transducer AmpG
MTTPSSTSLRRHPAAWVPSLYFAEGLPYFVVALIAGLMYKSRGVSNDEIARWTGLLGFVWVFKPLWSPFLETYRSKKTVVVIFELAGGLSLAVAAMALPLPGYFRYTIALLAVTSFCAATHDIAADGLYISKLSPGEQASWSGWQGGFFNVARLFAQGGLVVLAGFLETRWGVTQAWMVIFVLLALIMVLLSAYHWWALPAATEDPGVPVGGVLATLKDVLVTFFEKKNILLFIAFIILFRAAEGQVVTIGPLFLRDARESGGLGLSTQQVGAVYGTVASLVYIVGSILGGYFTAWLGLRRALVYLILAMNLPNLSYVYLSTALPTSTPLIAIALSLEMFGYGFGFVGLILFMMQEVAPGRYQTAHYSLATGFMQLGFVIFKMVSGDVQMALGYQKFFVWVLLSAIPALVLVRLLPFRGSEPAAAA